MFTFFATYSKTYTLEELQRRDKLPKTVDLANLEMYLSDADFVAAFGMDKETYKSTPKWKQAPLKKKAGLF